MTCLTASELSLLETLERQLQVGVTVSLLAELERELLRIRSEMTPEEWMAFCEDMPRRTLFHTLQLGSSIVRQSKCEMRTIPREPAKSMLSFFSAQAPVYAIQSWEHSLPACRSLRARHAYFERETAEVMRNVLQPQILVLGSEPLADAQFAKVTQTWTHWKEPRPKVQEFDFIYSPSWLDCCDDSQASAWLNAALGMLKGGGRLLAANFAPGSRDAGWVEACWNWRPFYRSEEQLAKLVLERKSAGLRGHTVFRDESGASVFLEVHSA